MSVKYINTIGFDVIDFFHIINLSTKSKYYNIDELIDHSNYLQKKNPKNSQFQQIKKNNNLYLADFEREPVGQEIKFFALKLYAAVILLKGKNIDIRNALQKSDDVTLRVLDDFIKYITNLDISSFYIFRELSDQVESEIEIDPVAVSEDVISAKKDISLPAYKQEPIYSFNSRGQKVYKTQRVFKKIAFESHNYYCACHEEKHYYFTAEATNKRYVEGHHMIPMEFQDQYWKDKKTNLDCATNLIPLCSHCHGKIHKSIKPERVQIITEVYNKYKSQILMIDNDLTFDKFAELYNVYIY
jgi:5-methylcytosine-specific restriction protein A